MTKEPKDPLRWTENDSDAPAELRALLRAGREDLPNTSQLAAIYAALEPRCAVPPGSSAPGSASLTPLLKGLFGVALLGGLSGALYSSLHRPGPPPPVPPRASAKHAPGNEAPRAALPSASPTRVETPPPSVTVAVPTKAPASRPMKVSLPSEPELLESARRALAKDPALALRLTGQHRARFRNGMLQQEREVVAIEALRRLGRNEEAERRAKAFEARFPGSAHRRGVEAGLEP